MPDYDIVTLGETMLRLTPPDMLRIEQARSFNIEVGGAESNSAVGLVRLGLCVCWISRLTDQPAGHFIANTLRGYGVDTTQIVWTDQDRVGLFYFEEGGEPRGNAIVYDRAGSAMSQMQPQDLPEALFHETGARLLHLTGITVALGEKPAQTCHRALELAKVAGWQFSFDLNYRSKLWSPEAARTGCEPFMRAADFIFLPLRDACTVYGFDEEQPAEDILQALHGKYPQATIAMTMGSAGALGCTPQGDVVHQGIFQAASVSRLGSGDAFVAGFLYGHFADYDLQGALRWGAAMSAIKHTIHGDIPLVSKAQVQALVEAENQNNWR